MAVVPSPGVGVAVAESLIRDLGRVSEWYDLWGMKLNASKTKTLILTYLDTWSGFEAAKTAPWPSRGLHFCGKFLEPSDESARRGCYCFLMW